MTSDAKSSKKNRVSWIKLRRETPIFGAVLLLVLLIHAWSLLRFPAPHVDEAWLTSRAWSFIQTGHQIGMLDSGIVERYDHYWIVNQWTITALQSLVLRLAGAPSIIPLRIFSLALGFALLGVTYIMTRLLGGRRLAAINTILLGFSVAFLYSSHIVRYDILAALLGYSALSLVLWNQKDKWYWGVLAGCLSGLAIETHLNSLIYLPAIGVCFLFQHGAWFWKKWSFWGYGLGLFAGAIYYLSLHYFPNPETYRSLNTFLFSEWQVPPILTLDPSRILQGFWNTGILLLISAGPMVLLALLAIPALIKKKQKQASLLLSLNAVLIVSAALVIPNKTAHYSIHIAPLFLALVAFFLAEYIKKPWTGKIQDFAGRILVWGMVGGAIAICFYPLRINQYDQFQDTQAKINAVVQENDTVIGQQVYWLGLTDHTYYSWELLFLYPRKYPETSLAGAFQHYRPDIFIIDDDTRNLISDQIGPTSFWYRYHLPGKETMDYLDQNAKLILDIHTVIRGHVQVYRLQYSQTITGDGSVK